MTRQATRGPSVNSVHMWHVYVQCEGTNEVNYLAKFYWEVKAKNYVDRQKITDKRVKAKNKYFIKLEPVFYEDSTFEQ